jgi:ribosomal protein S18 acetylase RimI-like enzyme
MSRIVIRTMTLQDIDGVVALQRDCFPPPFDEDLLWKQIHLEQHLQIFPDGQLVAEHSETQHIIGSASASLINEENWNKHKGWDETLGGFMFNTFDPKGTTLYGADISVHPSHRKQGVGKKLYEVRFAVVKKLNLLRYGTACRIPDYSNYNDKHHDSLTLNDYCLRVASLEYNDRTLTPLLKLGLTFLDVIEDYMDDQESGNAAALLEWRPV